MQPIDTLMNTVIDDLHAELDKGASHDDILVLLGPDLFTHVRADSAFHKYGEGVHCGVSIVGYRMYPAPYLGEMEYKVCRVQKTGEITL